MTPRSVSHLKIENSPPIPGLHADLELSNYDSNKLNFDFSTIRAKDVFMRADGVESYTPIDLAYYERNPLVTDKTQQTPLGTILGAIKEKFGVDLREVFDFNRPQFPALRSPNIDEVLTQSPLRVTKDADAFTPSSQKQFSDADYDEVIADLVGGAAQSGKLPDLVKAVGDEQGTSGIVDLVRALQRNNNKGQKP